MGFSRFDEGLVLWLFTCILFTTDIKYLLHDSAIVCPFEDKLPFTLIAVMLCVFGLIFTVFFTIFQAVLVLLLEEFRILL